MHAPRNAHDDVDIGALLAAMNDAELARAREALALIEPRGFARAKLLGAELDAQLQRWRP